MATTDPYNPIKSVDGATVRSPSSYQWKLDDVSAADSGRTEDVTMYKNRVGQVVGIELSWNNITTAEASAILTAFNPEYITVEYLDPMAGGYISKVFYVGNRSAPLYNGKRGLWSNVSFNLIARYG